MSEPFQQQLIPRKPVSISTYSQLDSTDDPFPQKTASEQPRLGEFQSLRWNRWKPSKLRRWGFVIVCCLIVVGMIFAIAFVLHPKQGRPLPSLPYHISINSVISVLVTIMKACILVVLAEGLGQMKWEHFRKRRPLKHLVVYDSASRGPLGCVELLVALRGRNLVVTLGALATVLTIPVDAFTQQLIRYYPCPVSTSNNSVASIPRASIYSEFGPHTSAGVFPVTVGQIGSMIGAVYAPDFVKVPFVCTTGDCEFDESYTTISYCSECLDVTNELQTFWVNETRLIDTSNETGWTTSPNGTIQYDNGTIIYNNGTRIDPISTLKNETFTFYNTTLPSGLWTADGETLFSMASYMSRDDGSTTVVEAILGARVNGVPYSEASGPECHSDRDNQTWGCAGKGAARCKIKPCVKTYNAKVAAGVLEESLLATYSNWFFGQGQNVAERGLVMADLSCVDDDAKQALQRRGLNVSDSRFIPYDVGVSFYDDNYMQLVPFDADEFNDTLSSDELTIIPKTCIYEIQYFTVSAVQAFLSSFFNTTVSPSVSSVALEGDPQALLILNNTYINLGTIDDTLKAMTQALSIRMRQWPYNNTDTYSKPVIGTAVMTTTCVGVRWPWLLYPAILAGLTLIFFLAMFSRTEVFSETQFARGWKNSPLPLVYHGINGVEADKLDGAKDLDDIGAMDKSANNTTGFIAHGSGRERLIALQNLRE